MKFGVYYTFSNAGGRPSTSLYAALLDHVQALEELGYDYALVSEHHFVEDGYLPSPLTMLAAFATRTKRIQLGTYVLLLPLRHPVGVAEDAAVVDILSGGRVVLGVAAGYRPKEFDGFGVERRARGRLMEQGLQVLRSAWGGGLSTFSPPVFPKPVRPIPLWVGGFAPAAVDRAVRLGNGYLIGGVAVGSADPYQVYLDTLAKHQKTQDDVPLIGNRVLYVAPTDEQAWADVGEALVRHQNAYARWFAEAGDARGHVPARTVDDLRQVGYIVGSPETCREELEQYLRKVPVDVLTFNGHIAGIPTDLALRSVELISRELMPHFRERSPRLAEIDASSRNDQRR